MNQSPLNDADALSQQLLAHLRFLRDAGVDWLPREMAVPETPSESPVEAASLAFDIALESTGADLSLEERRQGLQMLADEVKTCMRCAELCSSRTQTVFGQGEPSVELCFVGEAPGADEDAQGLPFVGAAGQMLNRIITGCGLKREEVYICNILKCRPPGNRTPLADEAGNCRPYLERQLELVQPKFIVALG